MPAMNTDETAMAVAAQNFDSSAAQLKTSMRSIENTGDAMLTQLRGQAGSAVQAALARYNAAMTASITELDTVSTNIRESGLSYGSSDADAAGTVTAGFQL